MGVALAPQDVSANFAIKYQNMNYLGLFILTESAHKATLLNALAFIYTLKNHGSAEHLEVRHFDYHESTPKNPHFRADPKNEMANCRN